MEDIHNRRHVFQLGLGVALTIFLLLVIQFKSVIQPLLVFSAIPLSFMGSLFFVLLTNQPITVLSLLGLSSLIGIVINDTILLINTLNHQPQDTLHSRIISGCRHRFVPIFLTSATTIIGVIPLVMSQTAFSSLGWILIGGLLESGGLVYVLPILYAMIHRSGQ